MGKNSIKINDSDVSGDVINGDKIIYGIDENKIKEIIGDKLTLLRTSSMIHDDELTSICKDLLSSATTPSLLSLFPETNECTVKAVKFLHKEMRRVTEFSKGHNPSTFKFIELAENDDKSHLIVASGGAGKTHALWNLGYQLLKTSKLFPIFISLSDFKTANEVVDFIEKKISTNDIKSITKNPSVIFLLDGWSQFPNNVPSSDDSERRKLLSLLGERKIIATGRYPNQYDYRFKIWNLEGLSDTTITNVISIACPNSLPISVELKDLLKLPLVLILYLILGGKLSSKGELISAFHDNLTSHLKDSDTFTYIISIAAARLTLFSDGIKYGDFNNEIADIQRSCNVKGVRMFVEQLGTLGNRHDKIQPIHDLYWEWLVGCGTFNEWSELSTYVTQFLTVRESIKLALESGKRLKIQYIKPLVDVDITLAAIFVPYFRLRMVEEKEILRYFSSKTQNLLNSDYSINQYRGVIGAITSKNKLLFQEALKAISNLSAKGYHLHGLENVFDAQVLWEYKDILSKWLKESRGKHYALYSIQKSSQNEWVDWLGDQLQKGNLTRGEAVEAALGCTDDLPVWIEKNLPELIKTDQGAYRLRSAAERGDNLPLARWVAKHYSEYVTTSANSIWLHFNSVIVNCGDDVLFDSIVDKIHLLEPHLQEVLLFMIIETGNERVGKLQSKLFKDELRQEHHKLYEKVYTVVSDEQAREWAESENDKLSAYGWSVLAKRHQNAMLTELIRNLPDSFSNIHFIPTIKAMNHLYSPPESLIDELWKRLTGNIQPMIMDDVLEILSKVIPNGIPSVVSSLRHDPCFLPVYHLVKFIKYLKEWQEKTGLKFITSSKYGEIEFSEFIVLENINQNINDHFIANMCKSENSNRVLDYIVGLWEKDRSNVLEVIRNISEYEYYHEGVVLRLLSLSDGEGLKDIINLFRNTLNTFPEKILILIFDAITEHDDRIKLCSLLAHYTSLNPSKEHINFHTKLLSEIITFSDKNFSIYRDLSKILSIYTHEEIYSILQPYLNQDNYNIIWIIRYIESFTKKLFINEQGEWIDN